MTTPTPHLNPPQQSRSRRTLERIVRASLDILAREGPDGLTVHAIVAQAESSVGSFYARFKGKEDLLDYLGERVWREAAKRWDRVLEERDLAELDLRPFVEGSVRLLADMAPSYLTYLEALDRSSGARHAAYDHFRDHVLQGIEQLLLERSLEIRHPNPPVAIHLGLQAALALLEKPDAEDGEEPFIDRDRRVEETVTLLMSYFGGEPAGPGTDAGQVDFFDIWG